METKIRIAAGATASGTFRHEGLDLNESWQEIDFDALPDEQKEALRTYRDTHVKIHPDDVAAFDAKIAAMPAKKVNPDAARDQAATTPQAQGKRDALSQGQPAVAPGVAQGTALPGYESTASPDPDIGKRKPPR